MKRKMDRPKTYGQDVVFLPAVTPIEASVIPAKDARGYGALHHAKASFRPGSMEKNGGFAVRMPKLSAWGPQRTKI